MRAPNACHIAVTLRVVGDRAHPANLGDASAIFCLGGVEQPAHALGDSHVAFDFEGIHIDDRQAQRIARAVVDDQVALLGVGGDVVCVVDIERLGDLDDLHRGKLDLDDLALVEIAVVECVIAVAAGLAAALQRVVMLELLPRCAAQLKDNALFLVLGFLLGACFLSGLGAFDLDLLGNLDLRKRGLDIPCSVVAVRPRGFRGSRGYGACRAVSTRAGGRATIARGAAAIRAVASTTALIGCISCVAAAGIPSRCTQGLDARIALGVFTKPAHGNTRCGAVVYLDRLCADKEPVCGILHGIARGLQSALPADSRMRLALGDFDVGRLQEDVTSDAGAAAVTIAIGAGGGHNGVTVGGACLYGGVVIAASALLERGHLLPDLPFETFVDGIALGTCALLPADYGTADILRDAKERWGVYRAEGRAIHGSCVRGRIYMLLGCERCFVFRLEDRKLRLRHKVGERAALGGRRFLGDGGLRVEQR